MYGGAVEDEQQGCYVNTKTINLVHFHLNWRKGEKGGMDKRSLIYGAKRANVVYQRTHLEVKYAMVSG